MERITIGELAQATGLSPATIRRYGAAGVLPPVHVDEHSGYRWYDPAQVETAVLARTLRQLAVPLEEVRRILAEPDPASRLARLDRHWMSLKREAADGQRERDHLARLFGGFQGLIDAFVVELGAVPEQHILTRRRTIRLDQVAAMVAESLDRMRARADAEGRTVLGDPVVLYGWPPDREDDDRPETPREVEVCLPVDGDGDAVLPGGPFASAVARGEAARFPQALAAYGAVSQWAREHRRTMLGPAREVRRGPDDLVVGWLLSATDA